MTPTFISHCESMYNALAERSTTIVLDSAPTPELVFRGAIVPVYKSLGISQSYYGPIFQTLEDVGAILKVQQGARGIDTVIVLRGLPKVWPEGLGWKGTHSQPLTEDSRYGKVLEDVQEMQESIGGINVLLALAELEERVVSLESKIMKMEATSGKK